MTNSVSLEGLFRNVNVAILTQDKNRISTLTDFVRPKASRQHLLCRWCIGKPHCQIKVTAGLVAYKRCVRVVIVVVVFERECPSAEMKCIYFSELYMNQHCYARRSSSTTLLPRGSYVTKSLRKALSLFLAWTQSGELYSSLVIMPRPYHRSRWLSTRASATDKANILLSFLHGRVASCLL